MAWSGTNCEHQALLIVTIVTKKLYALVFFKILCAFIIFIIFYYLFINTRNAYGILNFQLLLSLFLLILLLLILLLLLFIYRW